MKDQWQSGPVWVSDVRFKWCVAKWFRLKMWIRTHILIGYEKRIEFYWTAEREEWMVCANVTNSFRVLKKTLPFGFWIEDFKLIETFKPGCNARMDNSEKSVGYACEMQVWTVRPWDLLMKRFHNKRRGALIT